MVHDDCATRKDDGVLGEDGEGCICSNVILEGPGGGSQGTPEAGEHEHQGELHAESERSKKESAKRVLLLGGKSGVE